MNKGKYRKDKHTTGRGHVGSSARKTRANKHFAIL